MLIIKVFLKNYLFNVKFVFNLNRTLFIAILLLVSNQSSIYSQTSKYWGDYYSPYILGNFNNAVDIQPHSQNLITQTQQGRGTVFVQSSFNGDLMFLGSFFKIYDNKGTLLKNSDKLYIPTFSVGIQTSDNSWDALGAYYIDSANGYSPFQEKKSILNYFCQTQNCFDSFKHYPYGFYKTEIKRDSSNIGYFYEKTQNKYFNLPVKRIQLFDIKRTLDYKYQLLGNRPGNPLINKENKTVGLYHFSYQKNDLRILDSFVFNSFDYIPDSIKLRVPIYGSSFSMQYSHISRNRDKIFVNLLFELKSLLQRYSKELLLEINVDPVSGHFLGPPNIIFENAISNYQLYKSTINIYTYHNIDGLQYPIKDPFSPNDSIIFLHYNERKIEYGKTKEINQNMIAWRFREEPLSNAKIIFTKTDYNSENSRWSILPTNVNPYEGLTIVFQDRNNYDKIFQHFPNANNPKIPSILQTFPYSQPVIGSFQYPVLHNYDFLRIKKDSIIYKDCGAYTSIKNISDISNGLSDFKWYVAKNTKWTQWDSFNTVDLPTQFFTKSGKYLFKLHGTSYKGSGYKEWYIDTIIINIPPKPVADFYAKDSLVCRYTGLQFNNYSHAKDTLINNYLWSFGDGNTSSTKNPLYVYTKPGVYSVSLFYRNGFCDSTLTKNQYIRVVDAPKPGFSVQFKQGCSPFTANFTDTVTLNVKQKDYYFSDAKLWQNISLTTPNFTHIFHKAGVYRAVQRLSGFTGCVIQTDSVIFNISKGLTKEDTLNVFNSTVENNNASVYWNNIEGAVKYQLFKNGIPYIQQKDTFLNETTPYLKDVIYTVAGIDSCGNQSSTGRLGKPMFLQGNLIGNNEASIIFFSPYQQWKGTDITYRIQKLINGNWLMVNSEKTNSSYKDNQFLNKSELQACYRIEAYESSQPLILSHSNELCIPYIPTIFVPTAFSPNDDAINDVFDVTCFGIEKYNFTVYNRWGQEIFRGEDKEAWNGSNASEGVYLVRIEYTTNLGVKLNQRVNVTLLK